jgi:hypothetical protein
MATLTDTLADADAARPAEYAATTDEPAPLALPPITLPPLMDYAEYCFR